ncbi:Nephrocystin-3 [Hondaea fermentalgiana]|uniref:Nephrocystin-3 n=1 Tax=Hondaea fermentalgiana TaxID=2315210 RepID=A0A2R5GS35_9STRA|nr:Nephrocystin-3 [Hondaea fermentalgiana]|eukprot:GBG33660.1 Nephrocystin-3 [Hondaea fermentalgiana]
MGNLQKLRLDANAFTDDDVFPAMELMRSLTSLSGLALPDELMEKTTLWMLSLEDNRLKRVPTLIGQLFDMEQLEYQQSLTTPDHTTNALRPARRVFSSARAQFFPSSLITSLPLAITAVARALETKMKKAIVEMFRPARASTSRLSFTRKTDDEIFSEDARKIIDPRSISLRAIKELRDEVLSGEAAAGVKLYVAKRDLSDEVKKGATIQVLRTTANGDLQGRVSYVDASITFQPGRDANLKPRQDWSTEDVAEHVVLALTKNQPRAQLYLDHVDEDDVGKEFQGTFVSQARKCRFQNLVAALEHHFGQDADAAFVWLDLFCANQPLLTSADDDLDPEVVSTRNQYLTYGLHRAIGRFESAVIFFDRWDAPAPLQRAWCVWEIMGAISQAQNFEIIITPEQERVFLHSLGPDIFDVLPKITADNNDMRNAECWKKEDKEMIDNAVEATVEGGYLRLGFRHPDVGDTLNTIAVIAYQRGDYEDALEYYEETLSIRKAHRGGRDVSVATTLNNIAAVYQEQRRYEEALKYYEEALSITTESVGERHPQWATMLGNIANVYRLQGRYEDALALFETVLFVRLQTLGERHPSVANTLRAYATVYEAQGRYEEALSFYAKALSINMEAFGDQNSAVVDLKEHIEYVRQLHSGDVGGLVNSSLLTAVNAEERSHGRGIEEDACLEKTIENIQCLPCSDLETDDSEFLLGGVCVCRGLVNGEEIYDEEGMDYYCTGCCSMCMIMQVALECFPITICCMCEYVESSGVDDCELSLRRPCSDPDEHTCEIDGYAGKCLHCVPAVISGVTLIPLAILAPFCIVAAKPFKPCLPSCSAGFEECLSVMQNWRHCSLSLCRSDMVECCSGCAGFCAGQVRGAVDSLRPSRMASRCSKAGQWCLRHMPFRTQCLRAMRQRTMAQALRGMNSPETAAALSSGPVEWMAWRKDQATLEVRTAPNTPLRLSLCKDFPRLRVVRGDLLVAVPIASEAGQLQSGTIVEGDMAIMPSHENRDDGPAHVIIPNDLRVQNCLMLNNIGVAGWGTNVSVERLCILDSQGIVSELPPDLEVSGEVHLRDCSALTMLPLWTETGPLNLHSCSMLLTIPDSLRRVRGNMNLTSCTSLIKLPDNLVVEGNLILRGCAALQALPEGLTVKGDLIASGCDSLSYVPSSLVLHGNLMDLTNCVNIFSLPLEPFQTPRSERLVLNIANTSLVGDELQALRAIGSDSNVMVYLGNDAQLLQELGATVGPRGGDVQLSTLFDVAREFNVQVVDLEPYIDPAYLRGVLHFLSMLLSSQEFREEKLREDLKSRVQEVLETIARDPIARDEIVLRMLDATDACADKPIWALGQMQLVAAVAHARGDRAKLRKLGRGIMRLNIVHEHVERFINGENRGVDDVCVYLRFEIDLRESLDLPVSSQAMIYSNHVPISAGMIAAAKREALAITEKQFEAWLATWPEWQRQDRMEAVVAYLQLGKLEEAERDEDARGDASEWVDLKGEPIADPVVLLPNRSAVWSYNDVCERWVSTGYDFSNGSMTQDEFLNNTKRIYDFKPQTSETPQRASLGRRDSLRKKHNSAARRGPENQLEEIPERAPLHNDDDDDEEEEEENVDDEVDDDDDDHGQLFDDDDDGEEDEEDAETFEASARQAHRGSSIRSAYIVQIQGAFMQDAHEGCILTPFYPGGDLATWIRDRSHADMAIRLRIAIGLLSGLHDLHSQGFVHCDVKPENVFLAKGLSPVLGDFDGVQTHNVTMTQPMQATIKYMAPELRNGNVDKVEPAVDMFSVGVVLAELFDGSEVSDAIQALVSSLQSADPTQRPTALEAFRHEAFQVELVKEASCTICLDVYPVNCELLVSGRAIASAVPDEDFAALLDIVRAHFERDAAAEQERQLRDRVDAALREHGLDPTTQNHIRAIQNEVLAMSCPRCSAVFADFGGCCALSCAACPCVRANVKNKLRPLLTPDIVGENFRF